MGFSSLAHQPRFEDARVSRHGPTPTRTPPASRAAVDIICIINRACLVAARSEKFNSSSIIEYHPVATGANTSFTTASFRFRSVCQRRTIHSDAANDILLCLGRRPRPTGRGYPHREDQRSAASVFLRMH